MFAILSASRSPSLEAPPLTVNRINIDGAQVTLSHAAELRDDQLARFDLAQLNLLASENLPGCAAEDTEKLLALLDQWTRRVRFETQRNEYRFHARPEEYENSEAFYRMGMLITVLQQDLGVRYNSDLIAPSAVMSPDTDKDFLTNPGNVFLAGILRDRMGTCASMPVLYVAVGRRLGYPVKLVAVKGHLFARWEDAKERRNIEGTGHGIACHSDEHYVQWRRVTDAEMKTGQQLKSLSPREELAVFLLLRGGALRFHQRDADALVAYAQSHRLWPEMPEGPALLADTALKVVPGAIAAELNHRAIMQRAAQPPAQWPYPGRPPMPGPRSPLDSLR